MTKTKIKTLTIAILLISAVSLSAAEPIYFQHSTPSHVDGKLTWIDCPKWDWSLLPPECRSYGINCVPVCGKWPGDKMDIGAFQYIPGHTNEKPWGIWNGVPFAREPGEPGAKPEPYPAPPQRFRSWFLPAPFDLVITGSKL